MKLTFALLTVASAFALGGCSTPARVDKGPISAHTFSFVKTDAKPSPEFADKRQFLHAHVQAAITRDLAARGVTQVADGGDLTVAYLIIAGNNVSTTAIDDYFGYRDDTSALLNKAQDAYTSNKNPNYFEAGTLVIDLIDTKTYKVLKRGYATRPILRDATDETRAARIQEVVDEILLDVRINQ